MPNQIETSEKNIQKRLQRLHGDYMNNKITKQQLIDKGITALTNHYNKTLQNINKYNQSKGFNTQFQPYGPLWNDLEEAKQWWRHIARDLPMR